MKHVLDPEAEAVKTGIALIDRIIEEKGTLTVEDILGASPKGIKAMENFLAQLTTYLMSEVLEEKLLALKKNKVKQLIDATKAMQDYNAMGKKLRGKVNMNKQLGQVLLGYRQACQSVGIDVNKITAEAKGKVTRQ